MDFKLNVVSKGFVLSPDESILVDAPVLVSPEVVKSSLTENSVVSMVPFRKVVSLCAEEGAFDSEKEKKDRHVLQNYYSGLSWR